MIRGLAIWEQLLNARESADAAEVHLATFRDFQKYALNLLEHPACAEASDDAWGSDDRERATLPNGVAAFAPIQAKRLASSRVEDALSQAGEGTAGVAA